MKWKLCIRIGMPQHTTLWLNRLSWRRNLILRIEKNENSLNPSSEPELERNVQTGDGASCTKQNVSFFKFNLHFLVFGVTLFPLSHTTCDHFFSFGQFFTPKWVDDHYNLIPSRETTFCHALPLIVSSYNLHPFSISFLASFNGRVDEKEHLLQLLLLLTEVHECDTRVLNGSLSADSFFALFWLSTRQSFSWIINSSTGDHLDMSFSPKPFAPFSGSAIHCTYYWNFSFFSERLPFMDRESGNEDQVEEERRMGGREEWMERGWDCEMIHIFSVVGSKLQSPTFCSLLISGLILSHQKPYVSLIAVLPFLPF